MTIGAKTIPFFTADSASVTILRPLASSAFGNYTLALPEGIALEDVHDFEAPGNELGYVATLSRGRRVGGLARRFVRADVSVTADDPTDPDDFPASDVDQVLTAAADQVASDFFLESDISKAGLGPWTPLKDFKIGDRAHVEIFGHVVNLPVTRIDPIISDHDVIDWRVHVGGQLVSDEQARQAENEALHKAVVQDRRELAGVEGVAKRADRTASTIDDDVAAASEVVTTALGLPEPVKEHRLELSLGEVLAQAIEANTNVIRLAFPQENIVPAQWDGHPYWALGLSGSSSDQPEGYEVDPVDRSTWSYPGASDADSAVSDAYFVLSDKVDFKVSVWLRGGAGSRSFFTLVDQDGRQCVERWQRWTPVQSEWVSGERVMMTPDQDGPAAWGRHEYVVRLKPGTRRARVVLEGGGSAGTPLINRLGMNVLNRPQEEVDAFQSEQIAANHELGQRLEETVARLGRLQNLVIGNTHSNVDYEVQSTAVGRNSFVTVFTFTTAIDIVYNLYFRIGWDSASFDDYSLSIAINGVETYWHRKNGLGPLFPWENGYREMSMTRNNVQLREGDTITFRVWSNAPNASQRRVRGGVVNMAQVL